MSHDITLTSGKHEFAYSQGLGIEPWHGLGQQVPVEAMTASEAIEAAGLDWKVELAPMTYQHIDKFGIMKTAGVSGKKAVVRVNPDESTKYLSVVGDRYVPVQNIDAFRFFDQIVGNTDAKYHSVGSLDGGRRIWLMVRLPTTLTLDNGQDIIKNILLSNSHDGGTSLRIDHCRINVVCANTLTMALENSRFNNFRARHVAGILDRTMEAREALSVVGAMDELFIEQCNLLINTKFSELEMEELARKVWLKGKSDKMVGNNLAGIEKICHLFKNGTGTNGESAFDAYMALTEFNDHYKPIGNANNLHESTPKLMEQRVKRSWYTDTIRTDAFQELNQIERRKSNGFLHRVGLFGSRL